MILRVVLRSSKKQSNPQFLSRVVESLCSILREKDLPFGSVSLKMRESFFESSTKCFRLSESVIFSAVKDDSLIDLFGNRSAAKCSNQLSSIRMGSTPLTDSVIITPLEPLFAR